MGVVGAVAISEIQLPVLSIPCHRAFLGNCFLIPEQFIRDETDAFADIVFVHGIGEADAFEETEWRLNNRRDNLVEIQTNPRKVYPLI